MTYDVISNAPFTCLRTTRFEAARTPSIFMLVSIHDIDIR
jgi:hypothetical protein